MRERDTFVAGCRIIMETRVLAFWGGKKLFHGKFTTPLFLSLCVQGDSGKWVGLSDEGGSSWREKLNDLMRSAFL